MKFVSSLVLISAVNLSINGLTYAAPADPCKKDGALKEWAVKKGFSFDECSGDAVPAPENQPPSVEISSPFNFANFEEADAINFIASASDKEDGDLTNQIKWNSSIDGAISANTSLSSGLHTITASVTDSGSLSANATIYVEVNKAPVNTAPAISIVSPSDKSEIEQGTSLQFSADAYDAEDGKLDSQVVWQSSIDGQIGSLAVLSSGSHTITASVSDSGSLSASDSIQITVYEPVVNTAPTLSITTPSNNIEIELGTTLQFSANATDKEDGNISGDVTWTSSIDGSISNSATLSEGSHTITASVTDSGLLSSTDSVQVTVVKPVVNTPPTVNITAPGSDTVVEEGTALVFQANAEDAEDGNISNNVTWYSSIDGNIGNFTTLSVGQHVITASIADSEGLTSEATIALEVTALPEVVVYSISLTWQAPLTRADGTDLYSEELAGYKITMTESASGESNIIEVTDGLATSHVIDNLDAGDYSFTLQTRDVNGLISSASSPILVSVGM